MIETDYIFFNCRFGIDDAAMRVRLFSVLPRLDSPIVVYVCVLLTHALYITP